MREIDEVNAGHAASPSRQAGSGDQSAGRVEYKDIVRIEHGIEHMTGLEFVDALEHRDPVGSITVEMDKTFRPGDLRHRHRCGKRVATGNSVGQFQLVGAEADAVSAV